MNTITYKTVLGEDIELEAEPLGKGGEGQVFTVLLPLRFSNYVVKILKEPDKRVNKIRHFIANPPRKDSGGHSYLAWPEEELHENGRFVGFLMPRARGVEFEKLCLPSLHNLPQEFDKFDRSNPDNTFYRLVILSNLAGALRSLHDKDYVLGDLKPVNVFVQADATICILDVDSCQAGKNYPSLMQTPEYSPPEAKSYIKGNPKKFSWDNFSFMVMAYRLLVGIHPFQGFLKGQYTNGMDLPLADIIPLGYSPMVSPQCFEAFPPIHEAVHLYPKSVIDLFYQSLGESLKNSGKRPSAAEWQKGLTINPNISNFSVSTDVALVGQMVYVTWSTAFAKSSEAFVNGKVVSTELTEEQGLAHKVGDGGLHIEIVATGWWGQKERKTWQVMAFMPAAPPQLTVPRFELPLDMLIPKFDVDKIGGEIAINNQIDMTHLESIDLEFDSAAEAVSRMTMINPLLSARQKLKKQLERIISKTLMRLKKTHLNDAKKT